MRIWIVGPIAWDTVLYINTVPETGGFTHAKRHEERPGGQALNIATALANSQFDVGICGYVGDDLIGKDLLTIISEGKISASHINKFPYPTPHVVVLVDNNGERTMIGMEKSYFGEIKLNLELIEPEDLVVWPIWRNGMKEDFQLVKAKGCRTIVGLGALSEEIEADIAVGSQWELPKDFNPEDFLNKFPRIIATDNENGSREFTMAGVITQPALPATVVDTTGAGDGFVCGVVKSFVEGKAGAEALKIAATWAAKTVESSSSVPPAWN